MLIMVHKRVIDDVSDDNRKKNKIKFKFGKLNVHLSSCIYKNKLATLPFLLDIYASDLSWFSVYFYSFSFCMILQKMAIIFIVQSLSQVDRLRHSYPATCPVKIFVTWPCPALLLA